MRSALEIAARLGLHRAGRGWRGNCPVCGYREALALDERGGRPLLWCASCADREAMGRLLRDAGGCLPDRRAEPPERHAEAERIARARALWDGGERITEGCPAGLYLAARKIGYIISSAALRWRRDCPHPAGGRRIALLAAISGVDGKLQGVQRIYIDRDGNKAPVEPVKATLGPMAGGAVRLADHVDGVIVVAEGLESAAAAGELLRMPAWAAISAGNMAKSMILPAEIRSVVIVADHDAPGLRAAREAACRWHAAGHEVRVVRVREAGWDANDLLLDRS